MESLVIAIIGLAAIALGLAALAAAWIPPWLEGHITRPRLWGLGVALMGLFTATFVGAHGIPALFRSPDFRLASIVLGMLLVALGRGGRIRRRG